jgi:hypothetical protein
MKQQLQNDCSEQNLVSEVGFNINPAQFDAIITELKQSDDLLIKAELQSPVKAKSEFQYLRRRHYKSNKLEANLLYDVTFCS